MIFLSDTFKVSDTLYKTSIPPVGGISVCSWFWLFNLKANNVSDFQKQSLISGHEAKRIYNNSQQNN